MLLKNAIRIVAILLFAGVGMVSTGCDVAAQAAAAAKTVDGGDIPPVFGGVGDDGQTVNLDIPFYIR